MQPFLITGRNLQHPRAKELGGPRIKFQFNWDPEYLWEGRLVFVKSEVKSCLTLSVQKRYGALIESTDCRDRTPESRSFRGHSVILCTGHLCILEIKCCVELREENSLFSLC